MITWRLPAAVLLLLLALARVTAHEPEALAQPPSPAAVVLLSEALATDPQFAVLELGAARWLHETNDDSHAGPAPAAGAFPPNGERRVEARQETSFPQRPASGRRVPARAPPKGAS